MQHPVAYEIVDGRAQLTSLWGLLTNPYLTWQYPHVISGAMVTASMVMAGVGRLLPAVQALRGSRPGLRARRA